MSGLGDLMGFIRSLFLRLPLLIGTAYSIFLAWPEASDRWLGAFAANLGSLSAKPELAEISAVFGLDKIAPVVLFAVLIAAAEVHYTLLLRFGALLPPYLMRGFPFHGLPAWMIDNLWQLSGKIEFSQFLEEASKISHDGFDRDGAPAGWHTANLSKAYAALATIELLFGNAAGLSGLMLGAAILVWLLMVRRVVNTWQAMALAPLYVAYGQRNAELTDLPDVDARRRVIIQFLDRSGLPFHVRILPYDPRNDLFMISLFSALARLRRRVGRSTGRQDP